MVQLAAVPSPFELYPQVIGRTAANLAALSEQYFADPIPVVRATVGNQFAAVDNAIAALQDGDGGALFAAVVDVAIEPIRSLGAILGGYGYTLYEVPCCFAPPDWFVPVYLSARIFGPVFATATSSVAATWTAFSEVIDAIGALDLLGTVEALINIPGRIIDGTLNGYGDLPGLLTPNYEAAVGLFEPRGGPFAQLVDFWHRVGDDIRDRQPMSAAEPSNSHAAALMLASDLSTAEKELVGGEPLASVEDQDGLLNDVAADVIIDSELDSGRGVPAVVESVDDDLGDEEESVAALEVAVAENATELADEPASPGGQAADETADPAAENAEGSNKEQAVSPSTAG
ncbi:MAG: hypothetical protein AB7G47_12005 [Mycolicibacterium sp.]|uniref:hypothetical protein n=1 Tax=Mycolicibacterium sp. TaxID=2320850 RepID=UPI003D119E63